MRGVLAAILVGLIFSILVFFLVTEEPVSVIAKYPHHVVVEGDSLWTIAVQHFPGEHTGQMVLRIRNMNGLETTLIRPGQILRLEEE